MISESPFISICYLNLIAANHGTHMHGYMMGRPSKTVSACVRLVLRLAVHGAFCGVQLAVEPSFHQQTDHGHWAHGQLTTLPENGIDQRGNTGAVHAVDVRQPEVAAPDSCTTAKEIQSVQPHELRVM